VLKHRCPLLLLQLQHRCAILLLLLLLLVKLCSQVSEQVLQLPYWVSCVM
jgi:hypothetical protein